MKTAKTDELIMVCLLAIPSDCDRHSGAPRYEYHIARLSILCRHTWRYTVRDEESLRFAESLEVHPPVL